MLPIPVTVAVLGTNAIAVRSCTGAGAAASTVNVPCPTICAPLTGAVAVAVMVATHGSAGQLFAVTSPLEGYAKLATAVLLDAHVTFVRSWLADVPLNVPRA